MKNIIIINSILLIVFSISCKQAQPHTTNQKEQKKPLLEIVTDTLNSKLNYILNINSKNCLRKEILLSSSVSELASNTLILNEDEYSYVIFYEFQSARPMYINYLYINKKTLNIDSIKTHDFNIKKTAFDSEKIIVNNQNVCTFNFSEYL